MKAQPQEFASTLRQSPIGHLRSLERARRPFPAPTARGLTPDGYTSSLAVETLTAHIANPSSRPDAENMSLAVWFSETQGTARDCHSSSQNQCGLGFA